MEGSRRLPQELRPADARPDRAAGGQGPVTFVSTSVDWDVMDKLGGGQGPVGDASRVYLNMAQPQYPHWAVSLSASLASKGVHDEQGARRKVIPPKRAFRNSTSGKNDLNG